jgi:hypothetical protein
MLLTEVMMTTGHSSTMATTMPMQMMLTHCGDNEGIECAMLLMEATTTTPQLYINGGDNQRIRFAFIRTL